MTHLHSFQARLPAPSSHHTESSPGAGVGSWGSILQVLKPCPVYMPTHLPNIKPATSQEEPCQLAWQAHASGPHYYPAHTSAQGDHAMTLPLQAGRHSVAGTTDDPWAYLSPGLSRGGTAPAGRPARPGWR